MITPLSAKLCNFNLINPAFRNSQEPRAGLIQPKTDGVTASIFYVNDSHGKSISIERTATASKIFDNLSMPNTDKLKFSSGDFMLGEDEKVNKVAALGQNILGIKAAAAGNHEYDCPKMLPGLIPDMRHRLLACNIKLTPDNPLSKKVEKSYVEEINGHKYGVIGISPIDLNARIKQENYSQKQDISDIETTIKEVQAEVDKLKTQGINKIILLSHVGFDYDQKIAKETEGIDVILGGHSHHLLEGIEDKKNLIYSKSGEPVVITQGGRDGKYFGVLNLEFDNNGVIKKAQNNVTPTEKYNRDIVTRRAFEEILGKPEILGKINSVCEPAKKDISDPSGHANFLVDCMKNALGTDIALLSAANIRGNFESGIIDTRMIEDISPFKNNLCIINYSEKELVDALKHSAKSQITSGHKPGILHVSGLEYTMNKKGELLKAEFIDKNGTKIPIDINNPSNDKFYKTAVNDYHASGKDGFNMLNKIDKAEAKLDFDLNKCVEDYIRGQSKQDKAIDIIDDGRIKLVD